MKTTIAEEIYLRALTGRLVGEDLLASYNKVAVVSMKNIICSAMVGASIASFVSQTGGRASHFIVEEGKEKDVANQLEQYDGEAIILLFGGETPTEKAKKLFSNLLGEMAVHGIVADLIIHIRIFTAGGLDNAIKNNDVMQYLKERNVYVYTFDLDNGMMLIHEIELEEDITLHKIAELPITCEHANLLNKSLRNKEITWVKK
ncbi:MAG: hypothetical protein J7J36_04905 [Thermoplasmata archaeon]|nr:hypothetical protein [Thermoplasmata archaeon]